jgi:TolB-like protein
MPFVNKTNNAEMEYLSDGMTETLINSLSKIPNLNVKARSSVFRYKGNEKDFKKIADELNVQAILTGEVVQRDGQLVLSLELFETETENRIWGETYTRKQSDIVNLQNEIALDVSSNLKTKLSGEQQTKIANSGTNNSEAYKAYLRGRYFNSKGLRDSPQEALKYFQEAVALDPNFALGYAGLADSYTLIGTIMQARETPGETMPKAKKAAEKAIELDPNLSEAYVSLAWIKFRYDWDWAGAEKDFKKAIELNPNNAQAHQWYGEFLAVLRRDDQALSELKKAVELEPFNLLMNWNYAKTFNDFGRYKDSLPEIKKVYEMDKNFVRTYRVLRIAYVRNGMDAEAFDIFIKERELQKDKPEQIEFYKKKYQQEGYQETINWFIKNVLLEDKTANAAARAVYSSAIEDKELTMYWLEEAYKQRLAGALYCRFASYDFLKDDPHYQEFLRKLNFPQ